MNGRACSATYMNFLAYLFVGIPAGNLLMKIGYKKTALIAMAVGFIGPAVTVVLRYFRR